VGVAEGLVDTDDPVDRPAQAFDHGSAGAWGCGTFTREALGRCTPVGGRPVAGSAARGDQDDEAGDGSVPFVPGAD
jgi:hypothetical protein